MTPTQEMIRRYPFANGAFTITPAMEALIGRDMAIETRGMHGARHKAHTPISVATGAKVAALSPRAEEYASKAAITETKCIDAIRHGHTDTKTIAAALKMDKSHVTQVLNRLYALDRVVRKGIPSRGGRVFIWSLTAEGKAK